MIGIDLFSGAGGMSLGARDAGIDVRFVIEKDNEAANTYKLNHEPEDGFFVGDIRKFKKAEVKKEKGEQLIVFGGPPCQGFSNSNQKTRTTQNNNNWLFLEFLRVVKMYQPDWIVFENVQGIKTSMKGVFAEEVQKKFKRLGYTVEAEILNASAFGVPQKRSRFFLIASKNHDNISFPSTKKRIVTVDEAISDLPLLNNGNLENYMPYSDIRPSRYAKKMRLNTDKGCFNHLVSKNNELVLSRYKTIPSGGNWSSIPEHLMTNYKDKTRCHSGIYHRLAGDKPSVVIGNYRKNMLIHPYENRGFSVREAARLQSFPDDFVFSGKIGDQQQQVGNAVPPLLANEIFKNILKQN